MDVENIGGTSLLHRMMLFFSLRTTRIGSCGDYLPTDSVTVLLCIDNVLAPMDDKKSYSS